MEINPFDFTEQLINTLRRYIPTALNISRNYPRLRHEFRRKLAEQELISGPYVEALPDFEKGSALQSLLQKNGGYLHDGLGDIPNSLLTRPLHKHQQEALRLACHDRKSLLVATGTGSGKTETFLYPIANMLLNDPDLQKPGVRALIIYPMNALANDQLFYRIAPFFGNYLKRYGITFGRYTSQISPRAKKEDELAKLYDNERLMANLDGIIPDSWLITRQEMLDTPPHILLTNYAMLEHLLLLPRNESLFKEPMLRSIVLDEIHTYTGAQATEVAYLLRKLKNRLKITTPLQVFGTSASLSMDGSSEEKLLNFATDLFGETVSSVVRGNREIHSALRTNEAKFSLTAQQWQSLAGGLSALSHIGNEMSEQAIAEWNDTVQKMGLQHLRLATGAPLFRELLRVFTENKEVHAVANTLAHSGLILFTLLGSKIFPNVDVKVATDALGAVIQAGIMASEGPDTYPLLPGRYHIAATGIEGMCVSLDNAPGEGWKGMMAARNGIDTEGVPYFPLLVCRTCGQPFIEYYSTASQIFSSNETGGGSSRGLAWLGAPHDSTLDEDDELHDDNEKDAQEGGAAPKTTKKATRTNNPEKSSEVKPDVIYVDVNSGKILNSSERSVRLYKLPLEVDTLEQRRYVKSCPACGAKTRGGMDEIITPLSPGNEALGAVICQQVLDVLPTDIERARHLPYGGRTLLTFSDSRQDAAYFPPFFERTANDIALRAAALQIVQKAPEEKYTFGELARKVLNTWRNDCKPSLLTGRGTTITKLEEQQEYIEALIAAEFCTHGGRRVSLEALGCVQVGYAEAKMAKIISDVQAIMPHHQEYAEALLHLMLEHVRRDRAISSLRNIDMTDGSIWGEGQAQDVRSFECMKSPGKKAGSVSTWMPAPDKFRHNRRTFFLMEQLSWSKEKSVTFLENSWDILKRHRILVPLQPNFGLSSNDIVLSNGSSLPWYVCTTCGFATFHNVANKCPAFNCHGNLVEIPFEERERNAQENHYIHSYSQGNLRTLRAREHTAALSQEVRQEIERDFAGKDINLLSCTTTMEMGVDLGDLEAVVCLNVPPGISNYQQRTGRAGRRAQAAPFCVTLARSSRYDQSVFKKLEEYLKTPARVPWVHMANFRLFQRHLFSILLAGFLRHRLSSDKVASPTLKDLLGESPDNKSLHAFEEDLAHWLESNNGNEWRHEAKNLAVMVSQYPGFTFDDNELRNMFSAALMQFARTVGERWQEYSNLIEKAISIGGKDLQKAASWQKQSENFLHQQLLTQLSFHGIIPTYSFPVHSITLEVVQKMNNFTQNTDIELARDAALGITEYAPGSRVVANGRVWTSAGIAYTPKQFMPTYYYKICRICNQVESKLDRDSLNTVCTYCGNTLSGPGYSYIEPRGFVTAYEERDGDNPRLVRPRKLYADEARLLSQPSEENFVPTNQPHLRKAFLSAQVNLQTEKSGQMFILNNGPYGHGFSRCAVCGFMEPASKLEKKKLAHKNIRHGGPCINQSLLWPESLAHIFTTDIAIFRFCKMLPQNIFESTANTRSMALTITEAIRFAAAELLTIQDYELRGSYKIRDGYIDVILYDSVPGGAGYAKRIFDTISSVDVLKKAIERLDCRSECQKSCRRCLNDYSNQRHWEIFNRRPALEWLSHFIQTKEQRPVAQAVEWQPSLASLDQRISGYPIICLVGKTLFSKNTSVEHNAFKWLLQRLSQGTIVHCYTTVDPLKTSFDSHAERECLEFLLPYINKKQLVFFEATPPAENFPRIFAQPELEAPAFYSSYTGEAVLDSMFIEPAYIAGQDRALSQQLAIYIKNGKAVDLKQNAVRDFSVRELKAGEKRSIARLFEKIKGQHVEKITLEDPYACIEKNRRITFDFFAKLIPIAEKVDELSIISKTLRTDSQYYESEVVMNMAMDEILHELDVEKIDIRIFPEYSPQARKMHDRTLTVRTCDKYGKSLQHIFDFSGGIDHIMDANRNTKMYYYLK